MKEGTSAGEYVLVAIPHPGELFRNHTINEACIIISEEFWIIYAGRFNPVIRHETGAGAVWGFPTGKGRWNLNFSTYLCRYKHTQVQRSHTAYNHIPRHSNFPLVDDITAALLSLPARSAAGSSDPHTTAKDYISVKYERTVWISDIAGLPVFSTERYNII